MVEPSRAGLLGHWGRQSPIMLSTAHRFIQKPGGQRTARSRVDSALNSFGIAGGATEAARGWAMATWESEEASLAERQAWTQPQ